jgi:multidrug transporter EmrE-like cation transporter
LKPEPYQKPNSSQPARTRDFYRLVSISSAFSFGILAATLQSLHRTAAGFSLDPNLMTPVAFVIGALISVLYWKVVLKNKRGTRLASWLMALAGVGMFLYPLRFIPGDKLHDMAVGLVFAVIALSGVAGLLMMMKKFLSEDESNNE